MKTKLARLTDLLESEVQRPLSDVVAGKAGTLPEATSKLMASLTSLENLIGELRRYGNRRNPCRVR